MLRTIIRHANSDEGLLLGEFQPSEIPELRALLNQCDVYLDRDGDRDREPVDMADATMAIAPLSGRDRLALEFIVG